MKPKKLLLRSCVTSEGWNYRLRSGDVRYGNLNARRSVITPPPSNESFFPSKQHLYHHIIQNLCFGLKMSFALILWSCMSIHVYFAFFIIAFFICFSSFLNVPCFVFCFYCFWLLVFFFALFCASKVLKVLLLAPFGISEIKMRYLIFLITFYSWF